MLSLYDSFAVPGVPHVQIYRDDQNPHKFYMVTERAGIARDDDGKPLFTFLLYARDVDRLQPEQLEIERGYLAFVAEAGVPKLTEEKIRTYLRERLGDEMRRNVRFLWNPVTRSEPELGYPPLWLDGTVEFVALGPEMVPYSAGSKAPSLISTNVASYSALLNQDGAELFRQAVEKGIIVAGVNYSLSFAAKIPAITIRIDGNRGDFYDEFKNYVRHRVVSTTSSSIFGWEYYRRTTVSEWDELSSISKFRNTFHNLTIQVDDMGIPGSDKSEMKDKLESMAFEIFQTNILPSFFDAAIQDIAKEQKDPGTTIPVHESMTGEIHVTVTQSQVVAKKVNPNAQLSEALTPQEVKDHTLYVDLGQPAFQELDVSIHANVNFETDPVFGLKVFLDYDQQDEYQMRRRIKKAKEFLFRDAQTVGRFRQVMARGADGASKDSYRYWSEISYKDTGETIRVPRTGSSETQERQLVISYRRLGFVKVNLVMGTMPDSVKAVKVKMRYPGYSGPSGQQELELTREKPTATFFTYTGQSGEPGPYRYQISYVMADEQHIDEPEASGQAETLTIDDPFDRRVTTRFISQDDFAAVERMIVDASYSDPANDYSVDHHAEFTKTGQTDAWDLGLRDPNRREFDYNVSIFIKNGSRQDKEHQKGTLGTSIIVGRVVDEGPVSTLDLTLVTSLIDWARYKLVLLYLEYNDDGNNIHERKNFTLRNDASAGNDLNWQVLVRNRDLKSYRYQLRFYGVNSADNRETPWTSTTDPILVIE